MLKKVADFAQEKLSATRPMIKSYELGDVTPNNVFLNLIYRTFNVHKGCLETGEGEVFNPLSEDEQITKLISEINNQQQPEIKEIITEISKLNVEQIKLLLVLVKKITK